MNILLFGGLHLEPDNLEAAISAAADGQPLIVAPHPQLEPQEWLDALADKVEGSPMARHVRRALTEALVTGNRRQVGCLAQFLRRRPLVPAEALTRALRRSYALDASAAADLGHTLSDGVRSAIFTYDPDLRRHLRTPGARSGLLGAWVWADRPWLLDHLPEILEAEPDAGLAALSTSWRGLGRRGLARLGAELVLQLPRLSAPSQRDVARIARELHRACKASTDHRDEPMRSPPTPPQAAAVATVPNAPAPRLDLRAVRTSRGPRATWIGEDGARFRVPLSVQLRPGDYLIRHASGGSTQRVSRLQLASWALTEAESRALEDDAWEGWWRALRTRVTETLLADPRTRPLAPIVPSTMQDLLGKPPSDLLPDAPMPLRLGLVLAALGARAAADPAHTDAAHALITALRAAGPEAGS